MENGTQGKNVISFMVKKYMENEETDKFLMKKIHFYKSNINQEIEINGKWNKITVRLQSAENGTE